MHQLTTSIPRKCWMYLFAVKKESKRILTILATGTVNQGGHGTGKTGNLAVNFSRQGKHRECSKFNFLHWENCANTGKILKI